jgi:hypothetical protein
MVCGAERPQHSNRSEDLQIAPTAAGFLAAVEIPGLDKRDETLDHYENIHQIPRVLEIHKAYRLRGAVVWTHFNKRRYDRDGE